MTHPHLATKLVRYDANPGDPNRPTQTPIYQTATFAQPDASGGGPYDYSRSGNPTRAVLEEQLAALEGAKRAFALPSGMAALAAVVRRVTAGGHVVAGLDLYGGCFRLLDQIAPRAGISTSYVDTRDPAAVAAAVRAETELILVETPTNPQQSIVDIAALAETARGCGALLAVDNSLLSPWLQRPLEQGADVVIHSATKSLGGHGDLTGGVVATNDDALAEHLYLIQNGEGAALAPFDCWLLLRGLKTLGVRVEQQQRSAVALAETLAAHPDVERVYFPGLADHPGHALHARQASGPGSVISFTTGDVARSERLVNALELFTISVSFGCVSSLASLPCRLSHASIPGEAREQLGLPEDLVRLSIGLEHADDLARDLARALELSRAEAPLPV